MAKPKSKPNCWVCTGEGQGLCPAHLKEADDRAATYRISRLEAVAQMRETVVLLEQDS